jgi:hypothetical protein
MTVDQLIADLRVLPGRALVVLETVDTFVPVTGASSSRVHIDAGHLEPHDATDCAGCARQLALVPAVSLLGADVGGVR